MFKLHVLNIADSILSVDIKACFIAYRPTNVSNKKKKISTAFLCIWVFCFCLYIYNFLNILQYPARFYKICSNIPVFINTFKMVDQQFFIRYTCTPDPTDLVGDFVGHHRSHPLLVGGGGLLGVVQHVGLPVRD